MTKPYHTATPEQRPAHNVPETYTVKRMKTLALWTAGVLVAVVGWILADLTGWAPVALLALIVAAAFGLAGWLMLEYTNRAIERDLPRGERRIKSTSTAPIYFTRRMNVAGDPVAVDEQPVDLGGMKAGDVKRALTYLRNGGKPSRNAMRKSVDISQGQWAKLMDWITDEGYAEPLSNGSVRIVGDLSAAIDDLAAQLDRW